MTTIDDGDLPASRGSALRDGEAEETGADDEEIHERGFLSTRERAAIREVREALAAHSSRPDNDPLD
ncbi:hypothetical protein GCM10023065_08510 [Microbacterium laevaniformans]|nr:hypothetical protein GCM10017578_07310 [Microbacterium laevaniformans]